MAGKISKEQLRSAEIRIKKHEAIIQSMTRKERKDPALLISDKTSTSRQQRIARGSGNNLADTQAFLSEFQQMRTMMSRMSKGAGLGGDPMGAPGGAPGGPGEMGNRAQRRSSKKKKAKGPKSAGGFGKK